MSDLTTTEGVLEWACDGRGQALIEGPPGIFGYEPDTVTAQRIAENARLRQAWDAFCTSAMSEDNFFAYAHAAIKGGSDGK